MYNKERMNLGKWKAKGQGEEQWQRNTTKESLRCRKGKKNQAVFQHAGQGNGGYMGRKKRKRKRRTIRRKQGI